MKCSSLALCCMALCLPGAPAIAQEWDVDGYYDCVKRCGCRPALGPPGPALRPAEIVPEGDHLIFTNECGQSSIGIPFGDQKFRLDDWNVTAIVDPTHQIVRFTNGAEWDKR
jgi:hypothetical protein